MTFRRQYLSGRVGVSPAEAAEGTSGGWRTGEPGLGILPVVFREWISNPALVLSLGGLTGERKRRLEPRPGAGPKECRGEVCCGQAQPGSAAVGQSSPPCAQAFFFAAFCAASSR